MNHYLRAQGNINNEFYILNKDKYIVNNTINLIPLHNPDDYIYVLRDNTCVLDEELIKNEHLVQSGVIYEKLNTSGWNIKAKVCMDRNYELYIDYFEAEHPTYGKIIGDLDSNKIHVASLDAFKHFTDNHAICILDHD